MIKRSSQLIEEHDGSPTVGIDVGKLLAQYSSRESKRQSLPEKGRKDSDRIKERFV